jgi:hypothetical protein
MIHSPRKGGFSNLIGENKMINLLTVSPAYGRDYRSAKDAMADWQAGKDFKAESMKVHGYLSSRDTEALKADGFTDIMIRYSNLRRGTLFKI